MDSELPYPTGRPSGRALQTALLLFVFALALRLLFLFSMPEPGGTHNPYYSGDARIWLQYAESIHASRPFDLGLPLRPPGVAYLVALLWNGQASGLLYLKLAWCVMGAAVVALFFTAALRSFGLRVAVVAGLLAAASTGMMIQSTSPNNETPYLLLVIGSFTLWKPLRCRPRLHLLLIWATLQGLACLIRVEHFLLFALMSTYLVWGWARCEEAGQRWRRSLGRGTLLVTLFAAPLLPWQLHIFAQMERFNREPLPLNPSAERAYLELEGALARMRWSEEAVRERSALPAFCRRPLSNFVAATVAMRGGSEVSGEDFRIIEEAFGYRPEPLASRPLVALYGGLNFCLANNAQASGGFNRAPLEIPPPLTGGPASYPGFLIAGLPPPDLTFSYPPHLEILNHGYRIGWEWIADHPGDYLALAWKKMGIFWSGVAQGYGGYNLPLGITGIRRAVDMVVPESGGFATLWRAAALAALMLSLWIGRGNSALVPWLLLLATKFLTTLAFFGYAREGAVVIPVFALLIALLFERGLFRLAGPSGCLSAPPDARRWLLASCLVAVILVAAEGYRWSEPPEVTLDGQPVGVESPFPEPDYEDRRLRAK